MRHLYTFVCMFSSREKCVRPNRYFSLSVFDPEVMEGSGGVAVRERAALVDGLGLGETASAKAPLLAEILRLSKVWDNSTILKTMLYPPSLKEQV